MAEASMAPEDTGRFERTHAVADGRRLGYADAGLPSGRPLVYFHGTPSSRLDAIWLHEAAASGGWRLIAFDRPGLGLSSPNPDAGVLDLAGDVASLLDDLGVEQAAVLGYSGGAPVRARRRPPARRPDRSRRAGQRLGSS